MASSSGKSRASSSLQRRRSRRGRRKWAPQHFAFVQAEKELDKVPLWTHQRIIIAFSGFFVIKGGHSLLFCDRSQWTFPIVNERWLLIVHWLFATPFLTGVLVQRLTIPYMARAGKFHTKMQATKQRQYHVMIGRFTLVCSVMASLTASLLAHQALAGPWIFTIWSNLWLLNTVIVFMTAREQHYHQHKQWAEALSRNAIAFVFGRVLLVAYSQFVWYYYKMPMSDHHVQVKIAYYWAMVWTGLVSILNTLWCAHIRYQEERSSMAQMSWDKVRYSTAFTFYTHHQQEEQEKEEASDGDIQIKND